jgi:hypothetical protein
MTIGEKYRESTKRQTSSLHDIANGLLPLPDTLSSSSSYRGPEITTNIPDNSNVSRYICCLFTQSISHLYFDKPLFLFTFRDFRFFH